MIERNCDFRLVWRYI